MTETVTNRTSPRRAPRVMITHGYWANPDRHWFRWLAGKLTADGYDVTVPAMPDPKYPRRDAWMSAMAAALPPAALTAETLLVGHSLGCYATLHYLQEAAPATPIAGVLLVSGFDRPLASAAPDLDLINLFIAEPLDFDALRRAARHFTIISAADDPIVPHAFSRELAEKLGARFVPQPTGGHFMQDDGFKELPLAYDELRRMM